MLGCHSIVKQMRIHYKPHAKIADIRRFHQRSHHFFRSRAFSFRHLSAVSTNEYRCFKKLDARQHHPIKIVNHSRGVAINRPPCVQYGQDAFLLFKKFLDFAYWRSLNDVMPSAPKCWVEFLSDKSWSISVNCMSVSHRFGNNQDWSTGSNVFFSNSSIVPLVIKCHNWRNAAK